MELEIVWDFYTVGKNRLEPGAPYTALHMVFLPVTIMKGVVHILCLVIKICVAFRPSQALFTARFDIKSSPNNAQTSNNHFKSKGQI